MRQPVRRSVLHSLLPFSAFLSTLVGALALLAAAGPRAQPLHLLEQQSIEQADGQLQQQGWRADGEAHLDSFDRELSGNELSSLRSCSGTGAGFCRYDYRRGRQHLEVITVPGHDGDGLVHHWRLGDEPAGKP